MVLSLSKSVSLCSFLIVIFLSLAMFQLIIGRYQLKSLSKDYKEAPDIKALFLNEQDFTLYLFYLKKTVNFVSAKVL